MKVVAISGWKRSGKDTAADHLVKEYRYQRVAFADVLKDMVAEEFNIPRTSCDDPNLKETPLREYPVEPKDAFSRAVCNLMIGEFVLEDGTKPKDPMKFVAGLEPKFYWTPRSLCILKGSVNRSVTSKYWTQRAINQIKGSIVYHATADREASLKREQECNNFVVSDLRYNSEVAQLREAFGDSLVTVRVNRFDDCESKDASERDLDNAKFDLVIENRESLSAFLRKLEDGLGL